MSTCKNRLFMWKDKSNICNGRQEKKHHNKWTNKVTNEGLTIGQDGTKNSSVVGRLQMWE